MSRRSRSEAVHQECIRSAEGHLLNLNCTAGYCHVRRYFESGLSWRSDITMRDLAAVDKAR